MRAKSLVLLVVALGCGMIAAVAVSKSVMNSDSPTVEQSTVEIFVAVKDLPHAQKISAENVKLEKWPQNRIPEGSVRQLDQVEGKFTNQMIFAGEPILEKKIADSRESFSTNIPPGFRIFDITGNAGYIKPGDHVDIVGTFKPSGRNSVPETRTVMRNVQVFGIDGNTTRDSDSTNEKRKGSVFQLLVQESQLEALTLANSLGELRLNLRPFGEGAHDSDEPDTGETFLSWVKNSQEKEAEIEIPVSTSLPAYTPPAPSEPVVKKQHMIVITNNGVKRYEWGTDNDFPEEVSDAPSAAETDSQSSSPASPWDSGRNVSSGYGGYSPTYPGSVRPQPESTPVSDTVSDSEPPAEEAASTIE
jgi:pilus assembly protein CpaB